MNDIDGTATAESMQGKRIKNLRNTKNVRET
jgi:hypothetical protein